MIEKETNFSLKPLGEVLETLIDYRGKTPKKSSSGIKLITAKVIGDEGFISSGPYEYIPVETFDEVMKRGIPHLYDSLITTEAPLGRIALIRSNEKISLAQRIILLRANKKMIHPIFLFYALRSSIFQSNLHSRATGTTVRGIRQPELRLTKIPYFPLPIQIKIASILSAYDDLIENNTRRIQILEEMAQAIYREWFDHFRFPGHEDAKMVESELGLIPEGWEEKSLMDNKEFWFIRENVQQYSGDKKYYATANIFNNEIIKDGELFTYDNKPNRAQKEPKINSVWFARMKDTYKVLCFTKANKEFTERSILSSGMAGFEADEIFLPFIYFTINSKKFHEIKSLYCTGATQMAITNQGIENIKVLFSSKSLIERFSEITFPFINLQIILRQKNQILRQARDLLLPRLISGELDVSDFEIE